MFESTAFIKPSIPFDPKDTQHCFAPIFRKKFFLRKQGRGILHFCALGFGHVWVNGQRIDNEVFGTDESVYHKTLWYRSEDISAYLREGENLISVQCGNGFFNEIFPSSWNYDQARWRDHPKFICELEMDGQTVLHTDDSWKYTVETPITYNQIRGGEHYDARLEKDYHDISFDDSGWNNVIIDRTPPGGEFLPRCISPVVEVRVMDAVAVHDLGSRVVYDFGVNMSGYVQLHVKQKPGDKLTIRYGEDFDGDQINNPEAYKHYPISEYQTDHFICSGRDDIWSPSFSYHGFRYIELHGLNRADIGAVKAVFIHQDIAQAGDFRCSNEKLNRLFQAGVQATYSNFVCKPTDCPTREKLGWANDLMSSAEQMLLHFDVGAYFSKFLHDACDTIHEDGKIACIIPTDVWGYTWGNGPVSEGVVFELAYQNYIYTGDSSDLIRCLPYFLRNLKNYEDNEDQDGFCGYGLYDHAPPEYPAAYNSVDINLINGALFVYFLDIAILAANLCEDTLLVHELTEKRKIYRQRFIDAFIGADGRCKKHHMTAVALPIAFGLYDDLAPLADQLRQLVEENNYHLNCGMVGLRRLYDALTKCGYRDLAYRIITAEGFPGYFNWLDHGATTLWEVWNCTFSHNHHMYSDFMSWLTRNIAGIQVDHSFTGMERICIDPYFPDELSWCEGESRGFKVSWKREADGICVDFTVPEGKTATFHGCVYGPGSYSKMA